MTNQPCIEFENAFYHVFSRGVNKQTLFFDDLDRAYFISLCQKACIKYSFIFHAFCLMGNHYHLYIQTPKANLSKGMKMINESFSKHYTGRYKQLKKDGRVFRGPFGRKIVQSEKYSIDLLNYIHLNPVKDHFVKKPEDYRWSSYRYYIDRGSNFSFITKDLLLQQINKMDQNIQKYQHFFEANFDYDWDPEQYSIGGIILGDEDFAADINKKYLGNFEKSYIVKGIAKVKTSIKKERILNYVDNQEFTKICLKEKLLVYLLHEWSNLGFKEIAEIVKRKPDTIRKRNQRFRSTVDQNPELEKIVSNFKKNII